MKKITTTLVLLLFFTLNIFAQQLPFQGYVEESGVPVEGSRDFEFNLAAYGWTETFTAVPVNNGVYNIVLGSTAPLPANLFKSVSETPLSIIVNGEPLGDITIYKPLVNINSLLSADGNLEITGPNDSLNLKLGSFNPHYGSLNLYDSLGSQDAFIAADPIGGRLQLSQRDNTGQLTGAFVARTTNNRSYSQYYGLNSAGTGIARMMENYITSSEINGGPLMSGGYMRSGSDWYDNDGKLLAAIGNAREEASAAGSSGFLSLWGTNSFNAHLTGKRWENNDLPIFQLFGSNSDAGTFFQTNFEVEVLRGEGTTSYTDLRMRSTDDGGAGYEGVLMTSDYGAAGLGGGLEIRDNNGSNTVLLIGESGFIEGTGGAHLGDYFDNSILMQPGSFQMYGGGTGGTADDGEVTTEFSNNALNGRLFLRGDDGTGATIDRAVLESAPDGGGSSYGRITLFDGSATATITLEGINGNINSQGTIAADILQSSDGMVQVSDKRLKKDIQTLDGALENTLKMRGTTYSWKDENKSHQMQIGVIAQEVEAIYPQFVHTDDKGMKAVNYAQMTAVLIEAVKELNAKIEDLETENSALSAAVSKQEELNERITKLEKLLLGSTNTKVTTNE